MVNVNDIKNGMTIEVDGNIFTILEFQHVKPGKGAAFVKMKLKNLRTGSIVEQTFNSSTKVGKAMIEKKTMQYLYSDGDKKVGLELGKEVSLIDAYLGLAGMYMIVILM